MASCSSVPYIFSEPDMPLAVRVLTLPPNRKEQHYKDNNRGYTNPSPHCEFLPRVSLLDTN